jgi:adenine deaminase
VSSHGAELHGPKAYAWKAYLRETDDHESVTADDAVERARLGIYVSVREGSACYNLWQVIKAVTERRIDPRRFCLCTDVPSCLEIAELGHIDHALRKAISAGVPSVTAVQMATLNAAEALKVDDDHGGISPGKVADILLVEDLAAFRVRRVIADGRLVAEEGRMMVDVGTPQFRGARDTVRFPRE